MEERREVLWHGTTEDRATRIVQQEQFEIRGRNELFFAAGHTGRVLAAFFALRAQGRVSGRRSALVRLEISEVRCRWLRKQGLLRPLPFDQDDQQELRGRIQWVLAGGAIEQFNSFVEDWAWTPVPFRSG